MVLYALQMGHKVAEKVYGPGDPDPALNPDGGPTQTLVRLKPKPRRSTAFVVDPYGNLRGMLVRLPGMALPALASVSDLRELPVLPVEKFAVLTHRMADGDPRGASISRAAYQRWWEKLQTAREWMRYLAIAGCPFLLGVLAEGGVDEPAVDAFGNLNPNAPATPDAAQAMLNMIVAFRGGGAGVIPHGADLKWLTAVGEGQCFLSKIDEANRAIDKVITGQVLAGQEAQHGTRAQAGVHQDTAGANLGYVRGLAERMLTKSILWQWVALNRGPKDADRLAPRASLQKAEEQDVGKLMVSFTRAAGGPILFPSQYGHAHDQLGWPAVTPEEQRLAAKRLERAAEPKPAAGNPPDGGGANPSAPKPPSAPSSTSRLRDGEAGFSGDWDDSKHPRGQPQNKGEFGPGGGAAREETESATPPPSSGNRPSGKSKARVKYRSESDPLAAKPEKIQRVAQRLLGKGASSETLASMVGAPDDAEVELNASKDGKSLIVRVNHDAFEAIHHVAKDSGRRLYLYMDEFFTKPGVETGRGLGAAVFARQVEQAREAGAAYIKCHAAKVNPRDPDKPHNGYYTWPLFGFDQDVERPDDAEGEEKPLWEAVHKQFPAAKTVLGIMATPEGRAWWKANGFDLGHARFDLSDGSPSMTVFGAYLASKAAPKKGE